MGIAEFIIGRAFARPVGSARGDYPTGKSRDKKTRSAFSNVQPFPKKYSGFPK
jgi:hypothetical protein